MSQPEAKVKKKIKALMLKAFPGLWSFMPVQTGYGQHGIPDHLFCVPMKITQAMVGNTAGVFVAIEAKTDKGKLSKFQTLELKKIRESRGLSFVVYGEADARRMIDALERLIKTGELL